MAAAAAAGPLGSSAGHGGWNDAELEAAVQELMMEEAPSNLTGPSPQPPPAATSAAADPPAPAASAPRKKRSAAATRPRPLPPPWTRKTPLTGCLGLTAETFDQLMAKYEDGSWKESADGNFSRIPGRCWSDAALLAATSDTAALLREAQGSALAKAGRAAVVAHAGMQPPFLPLPRPALHGIRTTSHYDGRCRPPG
jgi:hypothetical protein